MTSRRSLRATLTAMILCASVEAVAQRRRRRPQPPPPPVQPQIPPGSTFDPNEVISVDVTRVNGMLRMMRVYLFQAPPNDTSFGVGGLGSGRRLWSLLPSCQERNTIDNRNPCPVQRVVIEAVGRGNVSVTNPQNLDPRAEDSRRAQGYVVAEGTTRVRVKVISADATVRYEAVVEAERLADLMLPQGTPNPAGFRFDFLQYPAR